MKISGKEWTTSDNDIPKQLSIELMLEKTLAQGYSEVTISIRRELSGWASWGTSPKSCGVGSRLKTLFSAWLSEFEWKSERQICIISVKRCQGQGWSIHTFKVGSSDKVEPYFKPTARALPYMQCPIMAFIRKIIIHMRIQVRGARSVEANIHHHKLACHINKCEQEVRLELHFEV